MTRIASFTHHLWASMIDESRGKTGDAMARPAILSNRNMRSRHACCANRIISSIMTRDTIAGNTRVIEDRWRKHRVGVANVTILIRWQMVRSLTGSGKHTTIVTAFAAT